MTSEQGIPIEDPDASGTLADLVGEGAIGTVGRRRGLDLVRPGLAAAATIGGAEADLSDPDVQIVVGHHAFTSIHPKPMESRHFGATTASLGDILVGGGPDRRWSHARGLLDRVVAHARKDAIDLLIARVDAVDVEVLDAAQQTGFNVVECTMTWLADACDADERVPAGSVRVDVHEGGGAGILSGDDVQRLADASAAWRLSHFAADRRLPPGAVASFYRQWIHNIADGMWCDSLSIARVGERVVGIQSEVSDRELLGATGATVRNGEWIVVLEPGLGAGTALMAAAGRHRFPGGSWHQWETQARNAAVIRCIEQTGMARPARAAYTLHAWPSR